MAGQGERMSKMTDLANYQSMFDLTSEAFKKTILDFQPGISSFNAQATQSGAQVVSIDEGYHRDLLAMQQYVDACLATIDQDQNNAAIIAKKFLSDYEEGKRAARYRALSQEALRFKAHTFDLALCPNLFFDQRRPSDASPTEILQHLCEISSEVRVFPLLNEQGNIIEDLGPLMLQLQQQHFGVEVREVSAMLAEKGNAMLRIWANKCVVA